MEHQWSYADFEGCIAHFKANPPEGVVVELDFSEEEMRNVTEKAARYDCTVDTFLNAVLACFMTYLSHKDARASEDDAKEQVR